jgi:CubicO group peptidase (beta-lactamase class C family)
VFAVAGLAAPSGDYSPNWPTYGWPEALPEQQGMDSQVLSEIAPFIQANMPGCNSFLIVRNGYLVYEQYFRGENRNNARPVFSITKSFVSALTGIALSEGRLERIDRRVAEFYPEYFTPFMRPLKRVITIRHCLIMSTGWDDPEWGQPNLDWRRNTILSALNFRAGEKWEYRSGPVHLLAGIIEKATSTGLFQLANQRLFIPMGIAQPQWNTDYQGRTSGGSGLFLMPRDLAKFGYLYLREGQWEGRQLVPAEWVRESVSSKISRGQPGQDYGYLWWLDQMGGYSVFEARGAAGQFIWVIPDLAMVVVGTADANITQNNLGDILPRYVFPAVLDAPPSPE